MCATTALWLTLCHSAFAAEDHYTPPASPRAVYSMDPDWRFDKGDVSGGERPDFDDSAWTIVSTPHTYNDIDSFRTLISHGGGDRGTYKGLAWYRKRFKLPADLASNKLFLEFEGMRQAGDIFLNGKRVGLYENGVTAYGVDISRAVRFGEKNVLAVQVDNRTSYRERATDTGFEWNSNDFNPDHGGINRHVRLHVCGPIYQTLPLIYGLGTNGVYVYGTNFDIPTKRLDVNVESQVKNSSGRRAELALEAVIVDAVGQVRARLHGPAATLAHGETAVMKAAGQLRDARFWCPEDPYLYDVYTILTIDGKAVDVTKVVTGFRKTEFKGGAGNGGVYLNDKFIYLKGFAQRSSDEWAGLGQAYPDWMHDYSARLMRDSNANYVRWMHVSPQPVDVQACDRFGIIEVCPAGDKERLVRGRQWEQRAEVMRDAMIYFRNNPSIFFWEAGNTVIAPEQMREMVALRKECDPHGGRAVGTRGNSDGAANTALTPVSEYYGVMIGQDRRTDRVSGPGDIFRGYSIERRDRAPLLEAEDFRDEGARRYWDDFSPPAFGFKKGPKDSYEHTSESFAVAGVARYWAYWQNRISNPAPAHSKWSGYASIYFSDSDADGRQQSSEVCRVSGKVDAVRLPKEIYFAQRVMQSCTPDIHILGHWNYPAKTRKTIYVICNCAAVELFLDGQSIGKSTQPSDGFVFAFPDVAWRSGTLKAVGMGSDGKLACTHELATTGPPAAVRLTPTVGPSGLRADGADVALVDVEVVDAQGARCPTDQGRIDFAVSGPAIWRGGYNSGRLNSTNNLYLDTECGINRVSLRSTLSPGQISLTARRPGLASAAISITSHPAATRDGMAAPPLR